MTAFLEIREIQILIFCLVLSNDDGDHDDKIDINKIKFYIYLAFWARLCSKNFPFVSLLKHHINFMR